MHTHTGAHTHTHSHFPFCRVSNCTLAPVSQLISHLSAFPSLSFISHPAVAWYWEWDDMAVQLLSFGWWIINAYSHRQIWSARLRSCLQFSRGLELSVAGVEHQLPSRPALIAAGLLASGRDVSFFIYSDVMETRCTCSARLRSLALLEVLSSLARWREKFSQKHMKPNLLQNTAN